MHSLIVLAHPEARSFNAQLATTARQALEAAGGSTDLADLYREGFDPREAAGHFAAPADPDYFRAMAEQRHAAENGSLAPEVANAIERLERADLLLFQFPLWWFSVPAILKGWLDRVFVYGGVYRSKLRYDSGRFRGKRALVSVTTGGPAESHGPDGRQGDLDLLLWPLHFSLHYVGFTVLPPFRSFHLEGGPPRDPEVADPRLEGYKDGLRAHLEALDSLRPIPFNGWDDWDETGRLKPEAPTYSPFMRHPD